MDRGVWSRPATSLGWWAVGLMVAIFPVAWVLMSHAIPWPILDTALAPVILVVLIDAAAACSLIALVKRRDRTILVWAAAVLSVPLALYATVLLVLEAISPH